MSILALPGDIMFQILSELEPPDLSRLCQSNKQLSKLGRNDKFWKFKFQNTFNKPLPKPDLRLIYYKQQYGRLRGEYQRSRRQLVDQVSQLTESAFEDPSQQISDWSHIVISTYDDCGNNRPKFLRLVRDGYYAFYKHYKPDAEIFKPYSKPNYYDPKQVYANALLSILSNSEVTRIKDKMTKLSSVIDKLKLETEDVYLVNL